MSVSVWSNSMSIVIFESNESFSDIFGLFIVIGVILAHLHRIEKIHIHSIDWMRAHTHTHIHNNSLWARLPSLDMNYLEMSRRASDLFPARVAEFATSVDSCRTDIVLVDGNWKGTMVLSMRGKFEFIWKWNSCARDSNRILWCLYPCRTRSRCISIALWLLKAVDRSWCPCF